MESSILFAQEGANVLLVDINLPNAEKGAALIAARYPNVKAIATKADVGKEADVKAAVNKAVQEFGRLDIMVRIVPLPAFLRGRMTDGHSFSRDSLTMPVRPSRRVNLSLASSLYSRCLVISTRHHAPRGR